VPVVARTVTPTATAPVIFGGAAAVKTGTVMVKALTSVTGLRSVPYGRMVTLARPGAAVPRSTSAVMLVPSADTLFTVAPIRRLAVVVTSTLSRASNDVPCRVIVRVPPPATEAGSTEVRASVASHA